MPRQNIGICPGMRLCFQGGDGSAARAGGRPRLALQPRLAQLLRQPPVADLATLALEEGQQLGADRPPSFQRQARHARQPGVVVGQAPAGIPHCHQKQHVGADLLGRELQRVADEIGDVELHERPFAHAGLRAVLPVALMEPAPGPDVMTRPNQGEDCR